MNRPPRSAIADFFATDTWSVIKKKLLSGTDMATSTPGKVLVTNIDDHRRADPSTPGSGGTKAANTPKSKRGAKAVDGNDADTESPSKKRKPNAKKAVKTEVKDEDGDNDEPVFSGKSQAPAEPTTEAKEQKLPDAKDGGPDGEVAVAARTLLTATQAMNGSSAPDV